MKELKKEDLSQDVFDLYDDYAHNRIPRYLFVEKLAAYAIGGITVSSLLSFMLPDYVNTFTVDANDRRINSETIVFDSPKGGGEKKGFLSMPKKRKQKLPGIIVVHENSGLNPYIADVGRRAAIEGFISLAPDALSPLGGYPGNDDDGREMQKKCDRFEMLEDFIAAYEYLKNLADCNGKVGVVGFCFGGWIANMMAVKVPDLVAAVPFYGGQPDVADVPFIKAPLLLHFAELDLRVNEGWPLYEEALKLHQKQYTAYMYPNVNHGFHNNTTPRYDQDAAQLAWQRSTDFFSHNLK